jgi:epoxide hydrolase-like predicted phosphatase
MRRKPADGRFSLICMKKTTIIFDCIGVIVDGKPIQSWCADNLGGWKESEEYFLDLAHRFDLAHISYEELLVELGEKVGRHKDEVRAELDARYPVDMRLMDYVRELKERGYKIGFLSNGNHVSLEHQLFSKNSWLKPLFDSIVISSEIGMVKPDARIYHHTLSELGSTPEETIFVDDSQVNVKGANAVGITGIFYTSAENLQKELSDIGI